MGELEQVRKNIDERYNAEMRDCIARFNSTLEQDENGRFKISNHQAYNLLQAKIECEKNRQDVGGGSDIQNLLLFENYIFDDKTLSFVRQFGNAYNPISIPNEWGKIGFKFENCIFNHIDEASLCLSFQNEIGESIAFVNCQIKQVQFRGDRIKNVYIQRSNIKTLAIYSKNRCSYFSHNTVFENVLTNGENNATGIINFNDCVFGNKDLFQVARFKLDNIEFKNSLDFKNCDFYTHPNFHNSKLHQDTLFHECTFYDTQSAGAEAAYRTLKQHMEGLHNENMMHEFHALELQSRRHRLTEGKKWWQWIRGKDGIEIMGTSMMEGVSNFGQNLWLPAWWLFIFLPLVFFSVYCGLHLVECGGNVLLERSPSWVSKTCVGDFTPVTLPMLHSFTNTLGPLSLIFKTDAIGPSGLGGKIIGMVQFVISSLIWFLWVVQIRRRFKM